MNEAHTKILDFKRQLLAEYLSKLPKENQDFFKRLYPNGPTEKQMEWAIQQCINTAKKIMEKNK